MDKYKEVVMKLITTYPSTTLAHTQMTILEDRLTQIFSQFRTPNHPPYAAMIQRALQELNHNGGSSEDLMSQFIKREYDDLPWAHFTMLKHHLSLLCKCGEIVVTRGPRYSLAVAGSGLDSTKCRRKHHKRRSRWDWERRLSKRRKTDDETLQIDDEVKEIEEVREVDNQQLKQEGAVGPEMLQLSVGGAKMQAAPVSLCSSIDLRQKQLVRNNKRVKRCPEPDVQEDLQPPLQQKLLGQEKPSCRVLRPRPPKPESVSYASVDKLPPSDNQYERRQDYQGRGRPPKARPDATVKKFLASDVQSGKQQQTVNRGRGRSPSSKPDATVDKLVASNTQFERLQHTDYRGIGRPRKAKSDAKVLRESISSIHQNQDYLNRPRRGRPPKANSDTKVLRESTSSIHQNQDFLNRPRRGRPPKAISDTIILRESTSSIHQNEDHINCPLRYALDKAAHTASFFTRPHQHTKNRRKGRPPKKEPPLVRESSPAGNQNQQLEKQPERRARPKPPEENPEATKMEELVTFQRHAQFSAGAAVGAIEAATLWEAS